MIHGDGTQLRDVLAANLRRLRIARHLSLSELARATRMSKATLSGIENGRANPTVETLASLAGALRVSISELLEELPLEEVRIVRAEAVTTDQPDGAAGRPLDRIPPSGSLELSELTLARGHVHEQTPLAAGSRTHAYVLAGTVIAGPAERCTELGVGDYASFPADTPHLYEAGRGGARLLLLHQRPV